MTPDLPVAAHLSDETAAAYADGTLAGAERATAERHLADCAECRRAVVGADAVLRLAPRRRSWRVPLNLAAAAALVLLLGPAAWRAYQSGTAAHRASPVAPATAPQPLGPSGSIRGGPVFRWTSVPGADAYRVQVMDAGGTVVWEATTADTSVALPDSIPLAPARAYFWQVQARTGFERWTKSELSDFTVSGAPPAR